MEIENKQKKRIIKWGIVFLVVMLIMTFVSKTIYTLLLPVVTIGKVSSGKIETKILAEGKIGHDKLMIEGKKVDVKATKEGEIVECYVEEGQVVKAGEPLVKIKGKVADNEKRQNEQTKEQVSINQSSFKREKEEKVEKKNKITQKIAEKKQEMKEIENSYEIINLQSQIEAKEETVASNEELFKVGALSENEYNKAKEELRLLKEQRQNQIKVQKEKYENEIKELMDNLKEYDSLIASYDEKIAMEETRLTTLNTEKSEEVVTSPIDGVVYEMNIAKGASTLLHDKLISVVPDNIPITLSFSVNDIQADKIEVEKEVEWKYKGSIKPSKVIKKNYDEKTGQTIVTCEVDSELTEDLVPDYKTYKAVSVETKDVSIPYDLLVPTSAIFTESTSKYIYTVEEIDDIFEKKYKVHKVLVSVEKQGDYMTAISGTIQEGDQIVKTNSKPLKDEAEVSKG